MSAALIDPAILFAEPDHGSCCGCCEGFCPKWEDDRGDEYADVLALARVGDVDYLGTHHCIIRRDAQADLPEKIADRVIAAKSVNLDWATIPDEKPAADDRAQSATLLDRLDRSGITRHDGGEVVHLYLGDLHVGWCKWNSGVAGIVDADLSLVRTIAQGCGITLDAASIALYLARGGV
jgi:hypothetical protein